MTDEERRLWAQALYSVFTVVESESEEERFFYDWWWFLRNKIKH